MAWVDERGWNGDERFEWWSCSPNANIDAALGMGGSRLVVTVLAGGHLLTPRVLREGVAGL